MKEPASDPRGDCEGPESGEEISICRTEMKKREDEGQEKRS